MLGATKHFHTKAYDDLWLHVPKGKKADLQDHAAGQGESLNGFVNRAIDETVARDRAVAAFTMPLTDGAEDVG